MVEGVGMLSPELICRAAGAAKYDRALELAGRHETSFRRCIDDLVHRDERKIERHELDDGTQTDHSGADADAGETVFSNRRVDDSLCSELIEHPARTLIRSVVRADFFTH